MSTHDVQGLVTRIERLERKNRFLIGALLVLPLLAAAGWVAKEDVLKVKRLEIVDDRGVPLVILSPDRLNEGGMITLRDKDGEKRGWWQAGPGTSSLTLNSEGPDATGDSTLGLTVGPKRSALSMFSKNGASLSAGMQADEPKVELYDTKGHPLFVAPWKSK
ncbi:hypothetical protein [Fimbriimonas ginsengisoli]|uniref:Uncharacterized protein n=1 Tax=Fimbriimonas ginsengisoli Gsoil 348 TaxID=661478 RepID=A0A068NTQ8_FIMGI|nr:hypothetical protein [Fimbriimonas ginsengisoli]AIE86130.1 hypothetical protein OP10G_2762 [Fimbriimonas ginsengisoli Gsoil 348]